MNNSRAGENHILNCVYEMALITIEVIIMQGTTIIGICLISICLILLLTIGEALKAGVTGSDLPNVIENTHEVC